jgi:hypothetical protein
MIEKTYPVVLQDPSGSRSKNRFSCEKDWGIAKAYKLYLEDIDFFVIFDCLCDIEIGEAGKGTISFYQIKTEKNSDRLPVTTTRVCHIEKKKKHSVLGALATLDTGGDVEKLTLVWNARYSSADSHFDNKDCFSLSTLPKPEKSALVDAVYKEDKKAICLDKYFYEFFPILIEEKEGFLLKETKDFLQSVLKSEPLAIPQFISMIRDPVEEAANCEELIPDFETAIKRKGITREQLDSLVVKYKENYAQNKETEYDYFSHLGTQFSLKDNLEIEDAITEIKNKLPQSETILKNLESVKKEKVPICTRGNDKSALIVVFLV